MEKSNILVSVMHLYEASKLLKEHEEDISTTLLELGSKLLDIYAISTISVDEAYKLMDKISSIDLSSNI